MGQIKAIEFKEFGRFLNELKDYGEGCSLCGGKVWKLTSSTEAQVDGESKRISHALPFSTIKDPEKTKKNELMMNNAFPILVRECGKCGHMTLFRYETVLSFLNNLEKDEDKGEHTDGQE